MVRHQEAATEGPDDLHRVANFQITHVVGRNPAHRLATVVFQHAFDGQREVVVARALTIARAGNRVLARMVGAAVFIEAGWQDGNALAFQHRERHAAKVQHDVVGVVVGTGRGTDFGDTHIADHFGGDGFFCGLGTIEVGIRMGCRPRWQGGSEGCRVECLLATGIGLSARCSLLHFGYRGLGDTGLCELFFR